VPSRAEVAALIKARWSELTARNSDLAFDLHYLEDGIEIDLIAESSADTAFAQTLAEQLVSVEHIIGVRVLQHIASQSQ
jgi:hypothetical protein